MFVYLFHCFFCSPRDSTGGLGVKMVEYVLGGSPTNKESSLSNMESRLRGLKFDENDKVSLNHFVNSIVALTRPIYFIYLIHWEQTNDDKDKENSPFDTNGMKKDESTNGGMNGIDDDKGFK